jgi:CubicO group peptidase (beta-lactamase class C family)
VKIRFPAASAGIATLVAMLAAAPLHAAPPEGFEARVESLRTATGVPGVSIAIVEQGKTTLARGFGARKLGDPAQVTADTIFPTGSTGKAVTVAALATLVDAGKIGWDDRVVDRLPGFQMYDAWVTREMTIRDLLVHRSGLGLGAGDLLFVPRTNIPRAEAVRRLRYIKPATSFRSAYAYDNVLYMVAGQLIEAVTGETWENYVRKHVLTPAQMVRSTSDAESRFATADRAFPHARMNGGLRGAGDQEILDERDELGRSAAPAGGLAVSANDMTRWLLLQLAKGALPDGGRLFSEQAHAQMWKPVVLLPVSSLGEEFRPTEPMFATYALGWNVRDYRGAKIVSHGGAVFGFKTTVVLMPQQNVGFAISINSEDGELPSGLQFELLDHYLGLPQQDWTGKLIAYKQKRVQEAVQALRTTGAKPAKVGPSLALARYAGTYTDAWYGDIEVAAKGKALTIDFKSTPRMSGRLEHWQYDTFVTRLDDKSIEPAYVTFALDADGKVSQVTMKAVSPLADFSYDYQDLDFKPGARGTE